MEEFVGRLWHKLISSQVRDFYLDQQVNLIDVKSQLLLFYQALGGKPGKMIVAAQPRYFSNKRRLLQRIAVAQNRHCVSWQDQDYIHLPPFIHYFRERRLNQELYFWLTAMMANLPVVNHWFVDNRIASAKILQQRPGLQKIYTNLVDAVISQRIALQNLNHEQRQQEIAIRQALLNPKSDIIYPTAKTDPYPVAMWLYAPLAQIQTQSGDNTRIDQANYCGEKKQLLENNTLRKRARRVDDNKQTDGLLLFQADSLLSWAEQVELDRSQQEDHDQNQQQDLHAMAADLDVISLSRLRRANAAKIKFDLDLPAAAQDDLCLGDGIYLPEWDYRKAQLVEDYCLLQTMLADVVKPVSLPGHLKAVHKRLCKQFALLQARRTRLKQQPFGDEIDVDAWLKATVAAVKTQNQQNYYINRQLNQRDIACLLLADFSLSTDALINDEQTIIDVIKETLILFAEALQVGADPFAIYGFSSIKNSQVRFHIIKNFNELYSGLIRARIMAAKPGYYTRMGAAIRQATEILKRQMTEQKLLLVVSDGKPSDVDHYEGRYGIEDTRHALISARQQGLETFCLTIDKQASQYLAYLFGQRGYIIVNDLTRLPQILPKLYLKLTGVSS